ATVRSPAGHGERADRSAAPSIVAAEHPEGCRPPARRRSRGACSPARPPGAACAVAVRPSDSAPGRSATKSIDIGKERTSVLFEALQLLDGIVRDEEIVPIVPVDAAVILSAQRDTE